MALAAGASIDEIVGTLIAVAPTVGLARVVSAAPELALALGYDVDAALETPERGRASEATPASARASPRRVDAACGDWSSTARPRQRSANAPDSPEIPPAR